MDVGAENTVLWATVLGEGAPLVAALVVSVVLARSGFREKIAEYREDTLMLVQLRADTVEKQLAEARIEIDELRAAARHQDHPSWDDEAGTWVPRVRNPGPRHGSSAATREEEPWTSP